MLSHLVTAAVTSCASRAVDAFSAGAVAGRCRLMTTTCETALAPEGTPSILHGAYHRSFGDDAVPRTVFYRDLLASPASPPQARIARNDFRLVPAEGHRAFVVLYHNRLFGSQRSAPHPESFYCPNRGGHCESFPLSMDVYSVDENQVAGIAKFILKNGFATGAVLGAIVWGIYGLRLAEGGDGLSVLAGATAGGAGMAISRRGVHPLAGILGATAVNAGVQWILDFLL